MKTTILVISLIAVILLSGCTEQVSEDTCTNDSCEVTAPLNDSPADEKEDTAPTAEDECTGVTGDSYSDCCDMFYKEDKGDCKVGDWMQLKGKCFWTCRDSENTNSSETNGSE